MNNTETEFATKQVDVCGIKACKLIGLDFTSANVVVSTKLGVLLALRLNATHVDDDRNVVAPLRSSGVCDATSRTALLLSENAHIDRDWNVVAPLEKEICGAHSRAALELFYVHVDGDSVAGASLINAVCGVDSRAILTLVKVHLEGDGDAVAPLIKIILRGAEVRAAHQLINTHIKDDCGTVSPLNDIGRLRLVGGVRDEDNLGL